MADENLFDAAASASAESQFDQLVGEGKKYKDAEALAKAYANADKHIGSLSGDLESLKEFMTAQFEQLSKREASPPAVTPPSSQEPSTPAPVTPPKVEGEPEDLEARIAKILESRDEQTRMKDNAALSESVLIERLGTKEAAVEAVRQKAEELGVSPQFLADTAFRSPKAFFNIMGVDPNERSRGTPSSSSDVNPRVLTDVKPGQAKPGTYAHYDQLRRTDPKTYWRADTQAKLLADAQTLGQEFFRK